MPDIIKIAPGPGLNIVVEYVDGSLTPSILAYIFEECTTPWNSKEKETKWKTLNLVLQ